MQVPFWPWRRVGRTDPKPIVLPDPRLAALASELPGWRFELRRTKRSLLGLRRQQDGQPVLRLHPEVLLDPEWSVLIEKWAKHGGRGGSRVAVRELLRRCMARMATQAAMEQGAWAATLATLGTSHDDPDLLSRLARDCQVRWFADLPAVPVTWGRSPPRRRLSHLRFGCYRRTDGRVEITPRLARPWIALSFLNHVLHHEFCHHRQAMRPLSRREGAHSARFRTLERAFPNLAEALSWERLALPWLLDDTPPPWYRTDRSHACTVRPPPSSPSPS